MLGSCSSIANSAALKSQDLRKTLLHKCATKFVFFGSGLAEELAGLVWLSYLLIGNGDF